MKNQITRRRFIKSSSMIAVAGGLAATVAPELDAAFKNSGKSRNLRLGLASYTTRALSLEDTIRVCKRLALSNLSLKDKFHLPVSEAPDQIAAGAAQIQEAGLELYGGGVFYMRTAEAIDAAFAYANTAGMELLTAVVPYDLLGYADQKIKEMNVRIAIHNHGPKDKLYPTPESAYRKIADLDPRFGLCIDIGHTQRSGVDPASEIRRFANRVLDVHLKDITSATADGEDIEMGRGVIDIPDVVTAMQEINYQGIAAFEYEKDKEDPLPGLAESVGYIRGLLAAN